MVGLNILKSSIRNKGVLILHSVHLIVLRKLIKKNQKKRVKKRVTNNPVYALCPALICLDSIGQPSQKTNALFYYKDIII